MKPTLDEKYTYNTCKECNIIFYSNETIIFEQINDVKYAIKLCEECEQNIKKLQK